ncbi:MAG: hypothetical protein ACREMQ_08620, partial [Longimicrobiales bacterium]
MRATHRARFAMFFGVVVTLGSNCTEHPIELPSAPNATTSAIRVIVETTGSDLDPDGYQVGLTTQRDPSFGIAPAELFVRIDEVAANCDITNLEQPRRITIAIGDTVAVAFA